MSNWEANGVGKKWYIKEEVSNAAAKLGQIRTKHLWVDLAMGRSVQSWWQILVV